ncbi:MAG: DEAD/DEAH box helicase family protein [Lachnospiraceae bacterium]|nr:DEAD/DEAH box helicase family protein [Lachnospiraceae bacterium]
MKKDIYTEYQQKTIAHILDRFQATPPARRMLCSDEVGLGKTYVAKGVIWGTALQSLKEGKDRLDVLYLCPNLNIADQNKRELGIQADDGSRQKKTLSKLENRSTMLYLQILRDKNKSIDGETLLDLYSAATGVEDSLSSEEKEKTITISVFPVTPDTSIDVDSNGDKREREYILRMLKLCGYGIDEDLIKKATNNSPVYDNEFSNFSDDKDKYNNKIKKFQGKFDEVANKLGGLNVLDIIDKEEWSLLRKAFAITTIQLIPYDLVIMDEFQNFTDIIQGANKNAKLKAALRTQRELMLRFMNKLGVNSDYKEWLIKQDEFFYELDNGDNEEREDEISKRVDDIFEDFEESEIDELCKDEIGALKKLEASEKGEADAINEMEGIIRKLMSVDLNNKMGQTLSSKDEHWKMVCSIMDTDNINNLDDIESDPNYYSRIVTVLNDWKNKNRTDRNSIDDFNSDEKNSWRLNQVGRANSSNEMKDLYKELREILGAAYSLQGVKKEDHPYAEIKEWALDRFNNNNEDENEKQFYRMVLMNLMIYRINKVNELNIELEYELWKYLKENKINNDNISYAVALFWCCFFYYGQRNVELDTKTAIIEQIFSHEVGGNTRILMLSATPFKLYMEDDEDEKAEGSQKKETIEVVCDFLQERGALSENLNTYKNAVKMYSLGENEITDVLKSKDAFEAEMTKYFTRMERNAVIRNMCSFRMNENKEDEECVSERIAELVDYVDELSELIDSPTRAATYAKQIPYALSFMPGSINCSAETDNDGYKAKKNFLKKYKEKELPKIEYSLLEKKDFDCYSSFCGENHGVFRDMLYRVLQLEKGMDNEDAPGAGALLWIPPLAVEKESLQGVFREYHGYGKTIVFSAWAMIPRGIATMISHEVRRRLLCTVFPEWNNYSVETRKAVIEKIKNIKTEVGELIEKKLNQKYEEIEIEIRKWELWIKLISSDITSILAVWSQTCIDDKGNRICPLDKSSDEQIEYIKKYNEMGRLDKVLEEYDYMTVQSESGNFDFIKSSNLEILFKDDKNIQNEKESSFFARGIGSSSDDDRINAIKNLQRAYNSPFAPFVFATTSMGQEGLNFHAYADKVIHWNLPANPVDFEQREGRIDRRNCFVIRRKLVEKYAEDQDFKLPANEFFDELFEKVKKEWVVNNDNRMIRCGMIPNWILPYKEEKDTDAQGCQFAKITRIVPYFAMDSQVEKYHKNLKLLQLYRSVIGQPDPEELLERLIGRDNDENVVEQLYLDFSPYRKNNQCR